MYILVSLDVCERISCIQRMVKECVCVCVREITCRKQANLCAEYAYYYSHYRGHTHTKGDFSVSVCVCCWVGKCVGVCVSLRNTQAQNVLIASTLHPNMRTQGGVFLKLFSWANL